MKTAKAFTVQAEFRTETHEYKDLWERQVPFEPEHTKEIKYSYTGWCTSEYMGKPGTLPFAEGNSTFSTGHPGSLNQVGEDSLLSFSNYCETAGHVNKMQTMAISGNNNVRVVLQKRQLIFKNFKVHTAEQAEVFEKMFGFVCNDFCGILARKYPTLSRTERIILALQHIEFSDAEISHNLGFSIEDLKRHVFILNKKMSHSAVQSQEVLNSHLQ